MVTPENIAELLEKGYTDIKGEISLMQLKTTAHILGINYAYELQVLCGPGETIRITIPTEPKRNTPMGEK